MRGSARWSVILVLVLAGAIVGAAMCARPALELLESLPPHRYHPLGIYHERRGLPVHPFVPIESEHRINLDIWSTDWPVRQSQELSYAESVRKTVYEFQKVYPNAAVKYRLIPLEDDPPLRMLEALKTSKPPDVYIGAFDPDMLAPGRSIPLSAFFGRDTRAELDPVALSTVTLDQNVWAWPLWVEIPGLVGNRAIMRKAGADITAILASGWTWEEFIALARKAAQMGGKDPGKDRCYGLVLSSGDPTFFECLLSARSSGILVGRDGAPAWDGQALRDVAGFLDTLREEELVPSPGTGASGRMLELFWQGRAMTIGPAWSGLARHVRERPVKTADPVLLPFPRHPGSPYVVPVRVCAGYVYSQPVDNWGERARLAVEALADMAVGGEISWLAAKLGVVPANLGERYRWQEEAGLSYEQNAFIAYSTRNPAMLEATRIQRQFRSRILAGVIAPALEKFWDGRISADQLAAIIDRDARDLLYPGGSASP